MNFTGSIRVKALSAQASGLDDKGDFVDLDLTIGNFPGLEVHSGGVVYWKSTEFNDYSNYPFVFTLSTRFDDKYLLDFMNYKANKPDIRRERGVSVSGLLIFTKDMIQVRLKATGAQLRAIADMSAKHSFPTVSLEFHATDHVKVLRNMDVVWDADQSGIILVSDYTISYSFESERTA
jgi:hypothetical protein